jgi:hypothetical protein
LGKIINPENIEKLEKNQMNEIEFFVELLNDKNADVIIKKFREPVEGFINPSLEKKKSHIKRIFKGQTAKTRRAMSKNSSQVDPFIICIKSYKLESLQDIGQEEVFSVLAELNEVEDYVKFANAFLFNREEVRNKLPELIERYHNGLPLFEMEQPVREYERAKKYFLNISSYSGIKGMKLLFEEINSYFTEDEKKYVNQLTPKIKGLSLGEFQAQALTLKKEYPEYLLYFTYGVTHPEESQEVLLIISANVFIRIANHYKNSSLELKEDLKTIKSDFANLNEQLMDYRGKIEGLNDLEQKIRDLENDINSEIKGKTVLQGKLDSTIEICETLKLREKKLTQEIEEKKTVQAKLDDANRSIKEYQKKALIDKKATEKDKKDIDKKVEKLETARQLAVADLDRLKNQLKILGQDRLDSINNSFAIIYGMETIIFEAIFSEIKAVHINEWVGVKKNFFTPEIKRIYVQREGLTTRKLNEIKIDAQKHNIEIETFMANSPKELLEKVAYLKCKERE